MVRLVGHSLLEGTVSLDVDDVPRLVALEVCAQVFHALCLVCTREHVSRAAPVALGVRHVVAVVVTPSNLKEIAFIDMKHDLTEARTTGWPISWQAWVGLTLILAAPPPAWANGKLEELAEQLGKMMEHPKSKSTQLWFARRWTTLYRYAKPED